MLHEQLADVLSKMNKVTLTFQEKQSTVFIANDKTWELKNIYGFEKFVSITRSLQCLTLKDISDTSGDINKHNLLSV